jgi:hypothetical protein
MNENLLPPWLEAMRERGKGPWSPEVLSEDRRRLAEFERTRMAIPLHDVKAWVDSWGTPNELPPPKARRIE